MPLVNNYFDFSAGNSIKEIRKMETEMSKLLNISKSVATEINEISNIKIRINLNTKDVEKNINDVTNSVKSLGTDLEETMSKVNGAMSKLDNNMSSRGNKSNGNKDFSKIYEAVGSYATRFADTVLQSSVSSALSGAISGGMLGFSVGGPMGAVAGAIISGGAEWALSEVKKKTDRLNQRVSFGSSILKTYLPKIAMSSLNYASNIEQSRINYKNMLGEKDGDGFVNKLLRLTNETSFDFSELDNFGKKLISSGFDSNESINVFRALGNASTANGAGADGVMQMIEALKNMKSTGKVSLDNLDAFDSVGVDAYGILADSIEIIGKKTKATKDDLKELVSKGVIPADEAIKYLISGMEDRYAGMMIMEKQSFSGFISTIKDSANQIILGPLGKGFIDGIKPALKGFSDFFGLGTKGFKDLSKHIYEFGAEIGNFAGNAINNLKNIFGQLFNDEKFKNADVPAKILMIYDEIKANVNQWYKENGDSLFDKIEGFFTGFIRRIGEESDFKNAVQDLWLAISPNEDTIKKIFGDPIKRFIFATLRDWFPHLAIIYDSMNMAKDVIEENLNNTGFAGGTVSMLSGAATINRNAIGLNRVPYDYYPALLHEGEAVLRRTEADNYRNGVGKGVIISKIADTIVVKDETDMYKIANILVSEIEKAGLVYGGTM